MTRPMPGPPEKYQVLGHAVIVWEGGVGYYYHPSLTDGKRLTDAECAAERWHTAAVWMAGLGLLVNDSDRRREHFADTWERFATHPHAFKETPDDRP